MSSNFRTTDKNRKVGESARLLILHCDDLGMAHSINRAAFQAMEEGTITSASVMVPCPWFPEVALHALERPESDAGIHFTLTSEWPYCRWGPVAPVNDVPSLVDQHGYLWSDIASFVSHARPEEAAREMDAQMKRALHSGIRPTHVDCHMFAVFQRPALFSAYVEIARRYNLPFLFAHDAPVAFDTDAILRTDDVLLDSFRMASEGWSATQWEQHYRFCLDTLGPGIAECAVHLGHNDEEMKALTGHSTNWGSAWRQRDLDVLKSTAFKDFLAKKNISLLGWKDVTRRNASSLLVSREHQSS